LNSFIEIIFKPVLFLFRMTNPIKIISKKEYESRFGKPNQEEIWDNISNPWKTYVVKEIEIVKEFLENKKGLVIDLGCGNGRNMIFSKDLEYYGVDFSKIQIEHAMFSAKQKGVNAKFFKSSAHKFDKKIFKNSMFDYGLFIATLHCIETKKQRTASLKEFYRVLKKGSLGIISVWNSEDKRFNSVNNSGDIYMSWEENKIPYMRYYYLYKKEEFLDEIVRAGFKIEFFYPPREHDRFSKKNWIVRVKK